MITEKKDGIVLESDKLKVLIEPNNGGKIRSFASKASGTEFLYIDSRKKFDASKGYSMHDISGYDECFPSIGPCEYTKGKRKGMQLGDHGLIWDKSWDYKIHNEAVEMSVEIPQLEATFKRNCRLEKSNSLKIDYQITNHSSDSLPYIYCTHLILNGIPNSRIELPPEVNKIFNTYTGGKIDYPVNAWLNLPLDDPRNLHGPFDLKKASGSKFFTDKLKSNWAIYHNLDAKESLRVEFDNKTLPYLGILVFQGYDNTDGHFSKEFLLGIEPTSGIGDELSINELTSTAREIPAGKNINFWIRLILQ